MRSPFKKLDIFIAKQFGLLFFATFFICQFVLMMQFLWRYVDELIGKGLSLEVMAQFFWYMGLMLMPQAFPLAILLSSLIAFGNLGESSELTAIKAAGISLMQAFRSLIVIVSCIAIMSFFFQEIIGPKAFVSFRQLLISMKQKNPEVEIPEGIFYDGIPGSNLYVQKKDMETGTLYGIMIYRMNGSYEDAAVILADSGHIQATAEKKHMLLTLYSGEWFENMRQSGMGVAANVPYRRETFSTKRIVLDFDSGFDMAEAGWISMDARAKSMSRILHDLDSIREFNDSVGHRFFKESSMGPYRRASLGKVDSLRAVKVVAETSIDIDSIYKGLSGEKKQEMIGIASSSAQEAINEMEYKVEYSENLNREERSHQMEAINKVTLSLSCLIFFFIGAPLELLGTAVLSPIAVFFTYKANNDSVVFNIDLYKQIASRMLGLRSKRNITRKEVIIEEPKYLTDAEMLKNVSLEIARYGEAHHLLRWPNPIKVFFRPGDDHEIEHINMVLESAIEDLSYSRNPYVLMKLNQFPIVATHAHTRPFRRKWLNIITGIFLPTGLFFYIRMIRFRVRLYRDLQHIIRVNKKLIPRVVELSDLQTEGSVTVIDN